MAINVQQIAPIHKKLHFLYRSVQGVLYDLINVLGPERLENCSKINKLGGGSDYSVL